MKISEMSVRRPVSTLMLMLIAALLGMVSLNLLPVDLYPEIEVPVAVVSVEDKGVAPQEIETLITKPVEQSVSTVRNLKTVTSYSREGNSIVVVQFEYGTDMDFAALEMREKVDLVKGMLPDTASTPLVLKIDPNSTPILNIGISSDMKLNDLKKLVEDEMESRFSRVEGVASVKINGGEKQEIKIKANKQKLDGYNLSLEDIKSALMSENINLPAGKINKGSKEILIRSTGEFTKIDEIRNIPILLSNGQKILLSDVANVNVGYKKQESISRLNGKNSISIDITKQSGANTVKTSEKVLKELNNVKKEFPELEILVGFDQSDFINKSINSVTNSAISGGILAIIVLFLFLRNLRSTFIVGISIPVSIISTFALMYFGNLSINLISLGGLALGVGMLVDNSIVVLENIYRHRENGESIKEAAINGSSEVSMAVFASTMTTVAVFLPIVFVKGFTAIIFKQLSFTVVFSLLASLIVAITVVPMMASKLLVAGEVKKRKHTGFSLGRIMDVFSNIIDKISVLYAKLLFWILKHRKTTVITAVLVFVFSMFSITMIGGEFFPSQDEGSFAVDIKMPFGTSLKDSDKIVKEVESLVDEIKEKEKVFSSIGGSSEFSREASNKSSVTVSLVNKKERKRSTSQIVNELRKKVEKIPGADIKVNESSSMGGGGPESAAIEIQISGDDIDTLKEIGENFKEKIKKIPGTTQVKTDTEEGDPEARIIIDRDRASFYGVSTAMLSKELKNSIDGGIAGTFKDNGTELDLTVSVDDQVKESIENLKQINIKTPLGIKVAIGELVKVEYANSPTQIARINRTRTVTVSSQLENRDLQSVTKDIQKELSTISMPQGYKYEFTGQQEDMIEAFSSLGLALILSIIIVYMILASQFESLIHPFTVMLSVPFALSGGFLGLFITGKSLSVPALIGVIMLSGIVVNNAIVLIDYIIQLRGRGLDRSKAIQEAGKSRFRPILMTTLTTVLGLIPIALGIGEGSETQSPMAVVVIGGLTLSTLLTLGFIPVMYTLFDDLNEKIKNFSFIKKRRARND